MLLDYGLACDGLKETVSKALLDAVDTYSDFSHLNEERVTLLSTVEEILTNVHIPTKTQLIIRLAYHRNEIEKVLKLMKTVDLSKGDASVREAIALSWYEKNKSQIEGKLDLGLLDFLPSQFIEAGLAPMILHRAVQERCLKVTQLSLSEEDELLSRLFNFVEGNYQLLRKCIFTGVTVGFLFTWVKLPPVNHKQDCGMRLFKSGKRESP